MDSISSTEIFSVEQKASQENLLLSIVKELCSEDKLSSKLKGKVTRIIADCELIHYSSLHRLTANDSTSTLLGFMHQTASELTFEEQSELNKAIIGKIQSEIPVLSVELDKLRQMNFSNKSNKERIKELRESIDDKLNTLEKQENEKVQLMMQWLDHRVNEVTQFSVDSSELMTLKTRILELKSKILHLQILQNIFTETNHSVKAYTEIHNSLKDSIKETEQRIKHFQNIIESDLK